MNGGGIGTNIDSSGVLNVATDETANVLIVTATSTADIGKFDTATVTVPQTTETYYLTVHANGGTADDSGSYAENTVVTISAGSRSNYTFVNWTSNNGGTFANANSASTAFTMPAGATTVTANWNYNGGSSSGGGSSIPPTTEPSGSTPPVVVPPSTTQPNPPTTVEIKAPATVDNTGNANANVTDKTIQDTIDKAVLEAKKNGVSDNGISIVISVTTGGKEASTVAVNFPKQCRERLSQVRSSIQLWRWIAQISPSI